MAAINLISLLSNILGVDKKQVANYNELCNKASPSISNAIKISGALGVSIDKIFLDLSATEETAYPQGIGLSLYLA